MAGSLRMLKIAQIPNSAILDGTSAAGPALPTINDLNPTIVSKTKWMWKGRRSLLFLPNGELVTSVKLHHHLQPLLEDSADTASDIYLVTRPDGVMQNPAGSLQHWSFYTQGFFYHLAAPDLPRNSSGKSNDATKSRQASCILRCENLRDVDSEDYLRLQHSHKVLLAYKVGQTDYSTDQVLRLAQWAVGQLSIYGLVSANCQHFATTMVRRTAMRVGDRSAFIGTAVQIVDFDLRRSSQPHVDSLQHGFVVAPPLPPDQKLISRIMTKFLRGYKRSRPIRVLYEKGPHAIGAYHDAELRYWSERFRESLSLIYHAFDEFKEDVSHKKWKDAFFGRYAELPDGSIKRPLQRKSKQRDIELTADNVRPGDVSIDNANQPRI